MPKNQFKLESAGLKFGHYITLQSGVVEEQVDEEFVASHLQPILAPNKGEAGPKLQQEAGDVTDQGELDIALLRFISQAKKVEMIRVL